ncbi:MAG: DUF1295 domain-containing protein [Deltaproteobacteria bacterium]|nr:DUF1295 domain-containing protein [Deltaproteobacteria bacterium]
MTELVIVAGATAASVVALMFGVWIAGLIRRDASIVDTFWGLGFVMIASIANVLSHGYAPRRFLVLMLVGFWGLRLAWHIALRSVGRGEDPRYAAMRAKFGDAFWWKSLFVVFVLQGVLMWVIALPILVVQTADGPARLGVVDGSGLLVFAAGLIIEMTADQQLVEFRARPENRGRVLDTGLWRWSRHPNYFGECLIWWGLWLLCSSAPFGFWTIVSPIVVTVLLVRVSGVPMLEGHLRTNRPGYDDYVRRTSAFVPWFPKQPEQADGGSNL